MKSQKLTIAFLALITLALAAHFLTPVLRPSEATAAGNDAVSPSSVAATRLTEDTAQVAAALRQIAQANQQIARPVRQKRSG